MAPMKSATEAKSPINTPPKKAAYGSIDLVAYILNLQYIPILMSTQSGNNNIDLPFVDIENYNIKDEIETYTKLINKRLEISRDTQLQ